MSEATAENDLLPVVSYPKERHYRKLHLGLHPTVDWGSSTGDLRSDDHEGIFIEDHEGRRLIGLIGLDNQCPVCGERGTLALDRGWTFVRGAEDGDFSEGEKRPRSELPSEKRLGRRLDDRGYRTIVCNCSGAPDDDPHSQKFYVGVAHPKAVEEYEAWQDAKQERAQVKSRARSISSEGKYGPWQPTKPLKGEWDHGDIIAGIYELLGVETYDAMDLAERTHVTKGHLAVILDRIRALTFQERTDYEAEDWLAHREFGVTRGVQWHVPEWVDAEGPEWSDEYRKRLFD